MKRIHYSKRFTNPPETIQENKNHIYRFAVNFNNLKITKAMLPDYL